MLNIAAGTSSYTINNSLRFRSSASAYLSRTFAGAGTNDKIGTLSFWTKRGILGSSNGRIAEGLRSGAAWQSVIDFYGSADQLRFGFGGSSEYRVQTTQVFRDPSAWYHILIAWDTTQATASNRIMMYVNGVQVTSFSTANYPAQNSQVGLFNSSNIAKIGSDNNGTGSFYDGYFSEFNFIDGQQLTPSSFGNINPVTGVWQPVKYSGTYGTNGFYLKFSDIATTSGSNAGLGKDFSGNGNYWTTNNISVTSGASYDAMIDSPTNASASGTQPVGNYAVWNPVDKDSATVIVDGNLKATGQNSGGCATFGLSSGKWYWEVTLIDPYNGPQPYWGTQGVTPGKSGNYDSVAAGAAGVFPTTVSSLGGTYANGTRITAQTTWANGDVIGFAFDATNLTLDVYRNNSKIGTTLTVPSGAIFPTFNLSGTSGDTSTITTNFGQQPFTYTPPSGYKALCTSNLPNSTVVKGNKYMDATLYTGNGSTNTITNTGSFQPNLVWLKCRSSVNDNVLIDSIRGTNKVLSSNLSSAQSTNATLTSFNVNGFSLSGSDGSFNANAATYVGWQWQAGQGTTSSNTNGSITSTTSVSTTSGFSVVTYAASAANATVGHGLGVAPKMVIVKAYNDSGRNWATWHTAISGTQYLNLNTTAAVATDSAFWNSTTPTSTVFSIGTHVDTNRSGNLYVAYCFAEIAGFSKFGSFTGNASTDNAFVYTGFRPKYVMMKRTDAVDVWLIIDSVRSPYNAVNIEIYANSSAAESTPGASYTEDLLSNGFKIRNSGINGTWIYAAFAESPFKNALAR